MRPLKTSTHGTPQFPVARYTVRQNMKYVLTILIAFASTGCISVRHRGSQNADEVLSTYFLMSAMTGKDASDFLLAVYPLRSQIVTFAFVAFHKERGAWPTSVDELANFVAASPANPAIPEGSLTGLEVRLKEDGSLVYSTTEDRQRGRDFVISAQYKVTMKVPKSLFASAQAKEHPSAKEVPSATASTISFDWADAIAQAIIRAALSGK